MLSGSRWLLAGTAAVAAIVAAIVVLFFIESEPALPKINSTPAMQSPVPNDSARPIEVGGEVDGTRHSNPSDPGASVATADDETGNNIVAFRANAAGELVLDEQTRLNIEALIAHSESGELYTAVREQTENLPPAAARRAEELVDKFISYQQAQRQAYPPDQTPPSEEDAVRQLEGLHALREAYFGRDVARRFYGKEEGIAREMIEVLRIENDQSLTAQEKLERAQALRARLPGVAAIEKANREFATTQE